MYIKILFSVILLSTYASGQNPQHCGNFPIFKEYIYSIIEGPSANFKEYPNPPKISDAVLLGLEQEITANDSAKIYLDKLSLKKFTTAQDYEDAFSFIQKKDYDYALLALAAHWNPDIRVLALIRLNQKLSMRPLVNSRKMKNGAWQKFDAIAINFLIYLLESNPLMIPGSENATIHGYYISNILWNLDLLTHENIAAKKPLRDWYKNDLQFEQDLLQWKSHSKK